MTSPPRETRTEPHDPRETVEITTPAGSPRSTRCTGGQRDPAIPPDTRLPNETNPARTTTTIPIAQVRPRERRRSRTDTRSHRSESSGSSPATPPRGPRWVARAGATGRQRALPCSRCSSVLCHLDAHRSDRVGRIPQMPLLGGAQRGHPLGPARDRVTSRSVNDALDLPPVRRPAAVDAQGRVRVSSTARQ